MRWTSSIAVGLTLGTATVTASAQGGRDASTAGAAAGPSFGSVVGWGPLRWNMTVDQARVALAAMGVTATEPPGSGATGMFPVATSAPGAPTGAPARTNYLEQTFHSLQFTHGGMRGTADFAGHALRSITLTQTAVAGEVGVRAIVADLTRQHGAPSLLQLHAWDQNGTPVAHWVNAGTDLVISTYRAGAGAPLIVSRAYHRLPRAWP